MIPVTKRLTSQHDRNQTQKLPIVPSAIPTAAYAQPSPLQNESKLMGTIIDKALTRVKKIAADFEIKRSQYKQVELPNDRIMMQVTIAPGTKAEVDSYRAAVARELAKLPPEAQPYFLVDAQRWQDQVLNPKSKPLVLYIDKFHDPQSGGERVYYWEFESSEPNQFGLNADGQIEAPSGQTIGQGKRWFGKAYKPPARYSHLVQVR